MNARMRYAGRVGLRALTLGMGLSALLLPAAQALTSMIAFESNRVGPDFDIYVMNPDGTGVTALTANTNEDREPKWSPQGNQIAFGTDRDGNIEINVMNADGSGQINLTNNPATDAGAAWSPDGGKIAFYSNRDGDNELFVMNADGSGQTQLTFDPANDLNPDWSPDGTRLAFQSNRDGGDFDLFLVNAYGTGPLTQLTANTFTDIQPRWSPDGTKILFDSTRSGNRDVFVMDANTLVETRLTTHAAIDSQPAWSPDGTQIVFTSGRDGNAEIYVMNADGTNVIRLTVNAAIDRQPDWAAVELDVNLDNKPDGEPNAINPASQGVIPVAILTTEDFDATTVDPLSATLGPGSATELHGEGHPEDVDGDGDLDLVLHFDTAASGLQCGDTSLTLEAMTFEGQPVEGTDSVQTVGCE